MAVYGVEGPEKELALLRASLSQGRMEFFDQLPKIFVIVGQEQLSQFSDKAEVFGDPFVLSLTRLLLLQFPALDPEDDQIVVPKIFDRSKTEDFRHAFEKRILIRRIPLQSFRGDPPKPLVTGPNLF